MFNGSSKAVYVGVNAVPWLCEADLVRMHSRPIQTIFYTYIYIVIISFKTTFTINENCVQKAQPSWDAIY